MWCNELITLKLDRLEEISHLTTEPEDSFESIKPEKPITLTMRINTYEP
jgi:hypothetical protein